MAVTHENGSLKPKTTKTNGISNKVISSLTSELANGSSGLQTLNGDDPSSNGIIDTSLINVFATKKINGLNGVNEVKPHDKNTTLPSAGVKLHPNVVLQQDMEDLDTKVS